MSIPQRPAHQRPAHSRLIRTEALKLTTVRGPWLLLAVPPAFVIAGISGLVVSGGNLRDPSMQAKALAHVGLTSIFLLAFGILAVAGEYRHKTITDTYLGIPSRGRVVTVKLIVYTAVGALSGVLASLVGVGVAAAWWADKGVHFAWGNSAMWTTIGGGIAWDAAFAAIGVGLGALIRSLVGAIAVALAWIAVVEGVVGQLIGNLARWLPFYAGQSLGAGGTSMLPQHLLPRWGGGAVLAGYAALFAAAAITTSIRRDVA
jgi:ABC-2 type transport system permease protein